MIRGTSIIGDILDKRNHAWIVLFVAAIVTLAAQFVGAFSTPQAIELMTFGTAWAPYSDALGPWLQGGLALLLGYDPPNYLYRPTIGVFWSSILAATGRIEMIPIFFSLWLLAFVAGVYFLAFGALRRSLVLWLCVSAICFSSTWNTLGIATTNADLAAFVLTASGVLLLLLGPSRSPHDHWSLIVGSLCLGVAGAIRGPMMLAGALMILVRILLIARAPSRVMVVSALVFAGPIALDILLQRRFGVINNGVASLFCVYFDPTHRWTPACHSEYLVRMPSTLEVIGDFVDFTLSKSALQRMLADLADRVSRDLVVLQVAKVLAVIVAMGLLASRNLNDWTQRQSSPLIRSLLVAGSLVLMQSFPFESDPRVALVWLAGALAVGWSLHLWRTIMCLGGYVVGTVFLAVIGLPLDRLQGTFSFTLYLGVGLLIMEARATRVAESEVGHSGTQALAHGVLVLLILLYAGNYLFPSSLRDSFQRSVDGQRAAMKISADPAINRSLYLTGDRALVYVEYEPLPVGAVRKYGKLAEDGNAFNESFLRPNAFVDLP